MVREILWEIEKSVAKTKSDEVSAVSINISGHEVITLFLMLSSTEHEL